MAPVSRYVPGHVSPGSPPLKWRIGSATLTKVSVSDMDNNSYILDDGSDAILIDAAADPILPLLPAHLRAVFTTHRHPDHTGALAAVVNRPGVTSFCGAADAAGLPALPDRMLTGGEVLHWNDIEVRVISLVGHTPGSIAVAWVADVIHLFTGDSLFPGGVGKTNSAADFQQLIDDVERQIFAIYPDSTVIHPGHGDSTTVGAERRSLPQWRIRGW